MPDFVSWENTYSIGIRIVDDQHKQLLILTNTLYDVCCSHGHRHEVTHERFKETIQSTVDYAVMHFAMEEKLMDKTNYPGMANHKNEHKQFVYKVLKNVNDFKEGKTFVPNAFVRFLRDWILEHIAIEDKKLGEFIWQLKDK